MKSELEFIKPENQSSEALEPSSTENIPLQCDSTIKSTVRSQELCELMITCCCLQMNAGRIDTLTKFDP